MRWKLPFALNECVKSQSGSCGPSHRWIRDCEHSCIVCPWAILHVGVLDMWTNISSASSTCIIVDIVSIWYAWTVLCVLLLWTSRWSMHILLAVGILNFFIFIFNTDIACVALSLPFFLLGLHVFPSILLCGEGMYHLSHWVNSDLSVCS